MCKKFCRDCRYMQDISRCMREVKYDIDLVRAKTIPINSYRYCDQERKSGKLFSHLFNRCGKEGRFYLEKD